MMQILQLNKAYGARQILCDINATFESGKIYGIVGSNGAGKTTLFKCLMGLESFNGSIVPDLAVLKGRMGYLPTEPFFFDYFTGMEYLRYVCNARGIESLAYNEQNIFDLPLHQYASTYSTGMKKKLAFMGVLMQKNDILILDEPGNGMDIQSNILMVEILRRLKYLGKTILISSHIFSVLDDVCDGIFHLENGRLSHMFLKQDFIQLEAEIKKDIIGDKIARLNL